MLASQYIINGADLYKRDPQGTHLLCVDQELAQQIMIEVHEGICGTHMNGRMLAKKIMRMGYFWMTMEHDCCQYVKKCRKCQIHANLQHLLPSALYTFTAPWPFSTWGIDIIGKVSPKTNERTRVYLSSHPLLHEVGRGSLLRNHHLQTCCQVH